ncbi:MAG: glycosyltransferase family 2 protein [Desulfobulbaceae bacterium]
MKFSIIIPAYNLAEFLADCLLSIQKQSFPDFEVLVVDDGSEDGTGRIAQEFADRDNRISVLHKENGGVSSARNLGLVHATGQFVWFIDGDDYIHPESLAYLHRLIKKYPEADYVTFDYDWTKSRYGGNFPSLESLSQVKPQYFDCTVQEGFENALRFSPIAVCCVCYRRRLIEDYRFREICTSEDRLYALEMCFSASAVVHTRAKIYNYYQRAGSATRQITREFMQDLFEFADTLFEFRLRKQGWGAKHLHFIYCVELFPGIMRHLLQLPRRDDRKWAFEQLLGKMAKVQSFFVGEPGYTHIDRIVAKRSFILAWCLLYVRYQPRRFLARRPVLLRCYQYAVGLSQ